MDVYVPWHNYRIITWAGISFNGTTSTTNFAERHVHNCTNYAQAPTNSHKNEKQQNILFDFL